MASDDLARLYDLDLADHTEDVELYLALAARRRHQRILELGCGTGRLAIPLARAGHRVVGVDNDPNMLSRARVAWSENAQRDTSAGSLELVEADVLGLRLGRRFDLVILGLNLLPSLGDRGEQVHALTVAARHLAPARGRAVMDVTIPTADELATWDGSIVLAWQRADPDTGDLVAKLWSTEYDNTSGVAIVTTYFDQWPTGGGQLHRTSRRDELHLMGASELRAMIEAAGMRVVQAGGDYSMSPLGPGSERVVLVSALL